MKQIKTILLSQLAVIAILLCVSAPAWANLAANTQILNTATLSYYDGSNTKTTSATVTVTVNLVPASVIVIAGAAQSGPYGGPCLTDSFTVTSQANGPDTYSYYMASTGSTNTTGPTVSPTNLIPLTVALGATITVANSTTTDIWVPSDGINDGAVNGIQAGDTVVIGTDTRNVQSVTDNTSGTSHIILTVALSGAPGIGVIVGEQKVVNSTVCSGTIITSGTDITVSDNCTVSSVTNPSVTATSATSVLNTFTSGMATLSKYVRNMTSGAVGTGTPYVYNSINYYPSGITANPNETLEYILVATNTSSTGSVTQAFVTDTVPIAYVNFKSNVYSGTYEITYVGNAASPSPVYLTEGVDADQGQYSSPTLTVYIGTGATSSAGGTLGPNITALVLFQVTVK